MLSERQFCSLAIEHFLFLFRMGLTEEAALEISQSIATARNEGFAFLGVREREETVNVLVSDGTLWRDLIYCRHSGRPVDRKDVARPVAQI